MNRYLFSAAALFGALMPLVFDSAFKGAVLLATAALVALALWRASAAARHLVWLVAIVALLVVPVLSLALPQWRVLPSWAVVKQGTKGTQMTKGTTAPTPIEDWQPVSEAEPFSEAPQPLAASAPLPTVAFAPLVASVPSVPGPLSFREYLPLAWCVGFAVLTVRLLAAHLLLRRASRNCPALTAPPDEKIAAAFADACTRLGIHQRVTLLLDKKRTIPVVWGVFHPRLILPREAREWSDEQLCSVLLHELGHIKRRDTLVQWLTQIACALHWWNPLVWFAAWRLHVERERACDDLVLASGVRPSAYAEHLLNVATRLTPARWTSACGLAMARKSSLEGRLMAVLSDKLNRKGVTRALAIVALVLGAAIALPVAMLRAADDGTVKVRVEGEVKNAQLVGFEKTAGIMTAAAIEKAGGFSDFADVTNIRVTRLGEQSPRLLNLKGVIAGNVPDFALQDGDVVLVERNPAIPKPDVSKVSETSKKEIERLLLKLKALHERKDGFAEKLGPSHPIMKALLREIETVNNDIRALEKASKARATVAPVDPIKEAKIQNDTLQLEMSEGETTLIFRVGTQTKVPRFAHFVPAGKARSFTFGLADGGQPWSERLEIRRANRESLRLPLIESSYLPAGEWVWRTAVSREGARLTFADIVKTDGEQLPVSIETGDRPNPNEAPFFSPSPRSIARAQFRVYDLAQGALEAVTKMKRADAERLVGDTAPERLDTYNGKPITKYSVITKSCQQAVIELIREHRYEVEAGGFEVRNTGVTLQIESDQLTTGIEARGAFQMCFHEGTYDSIKSAISSAVPIKGEKPAVLPSGKFRQVLKGFSVDLAEDEVLVIPLKSEGTYPGTPVAIIELQKFDWRKIRVSKPGWGEIGENERPLLPAETLPERETWTPPRDEPAPPRSAETKSGDSPLNVVTKPNATPHISFTNSLGMDLVRSGNVDFARNLIRVKDYELFAAANPSEAQREKLGFAQTPDHPVVNVTWQNAMAFCEWLTKVEREKGLLKRGEAYRLPTDLEWSAAVGMPAEKGATPEQRDLGNEEIFAWGTAWPPPKGAGNYAGEETDSNVRIQGYRDDFQFTSPVGSFQPNALGLFDMGGNVWQWVMDDFNESKERKVLRGGSWYNGGVKPSLLLSCRYHAKPDASNDTYGFRIVKVSTASNNGVIERDTPKRAEVESLWEYGKFSEPVRREPLIPGGSTVIRWSNSVELDGELVAKLERRALSSIVKPDGMAKFLADTKLNEAKERYEAMKGLFQAGSIPSQVFYDAQASYFAASRERSTQVQSSYFAAMRDHHSRLLAARSTPEITDAKRTDSNETAVGENVPNSPRTAIKPGRYKLRGDVNLSVTRQRVNGKQHDGATIEFPPVPTPSEPGAKIYKDDKGKFVRVDGETTVTLRQPYKIDRAQGARNWAFAWGVDSGILWLSEDGVIRSFDFSFSSAVKVTLFDAANAEQIPSDINGAFKTALGAQTQTSPDKSDTPKSDAAPLPRAGSSGALWNFRPDWQRKSRKLRNSRGISYYRDSIKFLNFDAEFTAKLEGRPMDLITVDNPISRMLANSELDEATEQFDVTKRLFEAGLIPAHVFYLARDLYLTAVKEQSSDNNTSNPAWKSIFPRDAKSGELKLGSQ